MSEPKYCPLCRSDLESRTIGGQSRLACASGECSFVHWNSPVPVVAGLVQWGDGYILARNASWPPNVFSLLTGFLENGESPEKAVAREIQEELGVRTQGVRLIGHFPVPQLNQLIIAFEARAVGTLALDAEIAEVKVVSSDGLANFDFGPLHLTCEIVRYWLQEKRRAGPERAITADGDASARRR
jgi:NADH pyrophosphatase NudC (nudix superfamily)